jgi:hypothetical protein
MIILCDICHMSLVMIIDTLLPYHQNIQYINYITYIYKLYMYNIGLRWSPWFRIIVERFLGRWWSEMSDILSTKDKNVYKEWSTIHRCY